MARSSLLSRPGRFTSSCLRRDSPGRIRPWRMPAITMVRVTWPIIACPVGGGDERAGDCAQVGQERFERGEMLLVAVLQVLQPDGPLRPPVADAAPDTQQERVIVCHTHHPPPVCMAGDRWQTDGLRLPPGFPGGPARVCGFR